MRGGCIESQEQERKRIASELHDSLGQYLLAIKNWALFGLNSVTPENPAREYLTEVSETTSLALEEVREMTHNLRPYQLERLGLTNTLEYMLKNVQKARRQFDFRARLKMWTAYSRKKPKSFFIASCRKPSTTSSSTAKPPTRGFQSRRKENYLEFVCRDDGRGFDVEAAKKSQQSGLGLEGIAERLKILGGQFEIASEIGKGTTVSVKIYNRQ